MYFTLAIATVREVLFGFSVGFAAKLDLFQQYQLPHIPLV